MRFILDRLNRLELFFANFTFVIVCWHDYYLCGTGGTRTHDLRIKSPQLYQLSYGSMWLLMTHRSLITFTYEKINTKERVSNPSGTGEEVEGFEPPMVFYTMADFKSAALQPLGHTSKMKYLYFLNSNFPSASAIIIASMYSRCESAPGISALRFVRFS